MTAADALPEPSAAVSPPPERAPFIRGRGLVKRYGTLAAVDGIDLDVAAGESCGLLGPNGAGKTTLVRLVTCFSPLTAGELSVAGLDVRRRPRAIKALAGVVPQEDNLDPDLTVRQNLLVYARYHRLERERAARRADELLEFVGLTEKRASAIRELSGGLKRRLILARALLAEPRLLVLDEPTTGLDPQARHAVWERIRSLRRGGTTILLTTHYMEEAHQLCDRVAIIDRGKFLVQGPPAALVAEHAPGNVIEVWDYPAALPDWLRERGQTAEEIGDRLFLHVADGEVLYRELTERFAGAGLVFRRGSLEDVFLKFTGRQLRS